jgi:pSer/pThr/pTyr-binding forkhead associated (FHA) protein
MTTPASPSSSGQARGARLVLTPLAGGGPRPPACPAGSALTLGRDASCDVVLDHETVSRRHARIVDHDGAWWVQDLESANGTRIDGAPVRQAVLADGARLGLGAFEYRVSLRAPRARRFPGSGLFVWRLVGDDARTAAVDRLLWSRQTVIGRSDTADVVVREAQVSALHARLSYRADGLHVSDLGSANGVRVNGEPVRQARLRPGDRLEVADLPFLARPTWRPGPPLGGGLALVTALLVVLMLLPTGTRRTLDADRWWTRDMYLEQAERSLGEAVQAWRRPEPARELARASIDIALRSLAAVDWLPADDATDADVDAALRRASVEFGGDLADHDLVAMREAIEAPPPAATPAPAADVAESPPPSTAPFTLESELALIMAEFGVDTSHQPVPDDLVAEIARYVRFWSDEKRGFSRRAWQRGQEHMPIIVAALRRHRLPDSFCYLPFMESGYRTAVTSHAGARGLWQFMPATGRHFGLRVDDEVDERTDPVKATEAACRYLRYLLNAFGANSFMCAVAAYNKGEHGVLRCLGRGADWRSRWKFWDIATRGDGCLKPETIAYVPKFLAAAVVLRRPDVFALTEVVP